MGDMGFDSLVDIQKMAANLPPAEGNPAPAAPVLPAPAAPTDQPPAGNSPTTSPTDNSGAPLEVPRTDDNNAPAGDPQDAEGDKNNQPSPAAPAPDAPPADAPDGVPAQTEGVIDPVFGKETPEQYKTRLTAEAQVDANHRAQQELLQQFNVSTVEELNAKINKPETLTEEQKKRNNDLHRNDVMSYAVKEMGMSPDDFNRMSRWEQMNDQDLVFEHFHQKWMAENKENPLFAGKDLEQEARYEFSTLFHLNNENERYRQLGEQSLKATAEQLRNQQKDVWTAAEGSYQDYKQQIADISLFKKEIQHAIGTGLPKEMTFKVDDKGTTATFQLDKINKPDLEKFLRQQANYNQFMKSGKKDFQPFLADKIHEYIAINHYKDMIATVSRTAHDAGVKQGSVGARAPFTTAQPQPATVSANELTPAERQKIADITRRG
jgi:hypothetical protein